MILWYFSYKGDTHGCTSKDIYCHLKIELGYYSFKEEYKLSKQEIHELKKVVIESIAVQLEQRDSYQTGLRRFVEVNLLGRNEILNLRNPYDETAYWLNVFHNFIQLIIENDFDMSIEFSDDLDYLPKGVEKLLEMRRDN